MSRPSWWRRIYWTRFGKPVEDRALFTELVNGCFSSVLEIGIGDCQRIRRIAKLIQLPAGTERLRYIGTDEFEAAQDGRRHYSLKQAHKIVGVLGFKASLVPGDIGSAVPRVAHKMGASDLIIIDGGVDPQNLSAGPIGSWLNRIGHEQSVILASAEPGAVLQKVSVQDLPLPHGRAA